MSGTLLNLALAVFLLAANGFYVASEFALVKSRGFRIDALAEEARFGARLLQRMLGNVEAYLACCQLGITMASLGLGWIGEPTVAGLLEPILDADRHAARALDFTAFLVGFLVFSSLHIVLGEQVPKTLAIREPEPVSLWIAYPLHVSYILFYPLNWVLNTASRSILPSLRRPRGLAPGDPDRRRDRGPGRGLGRARRDGGEQAEYIHNLFRFGELEVADVMVHRTNMRPVNVDEPPERVIDEILATPYTPRAGLGERAGEHRRHRPRQGPLASDCDGAGGDCRQGRHPRHRHQAVVRARYDQPQRPAQRLPQAQVALRPRRRRVWRGAGAGDARGHHRGDRRRHLRRARHRRCQGVRPQPDGSVNVDGAVPIRDLNRAMDWDLPDEEATTVAGLVIHEARIIPEPGQAFTFHGFRFQVLRKNRNRITALQHHAAGESKSPPPVSTAWLKTAHFDTDWSIRALFFPNMNLPSIDWMLFPGNTSSHAMSSVGDTELSVMVTCFAIFKYIPSHFLGKVNRICRAIFIDRNSYIRIRLVENPEPTRYGRVIIKSKRN